MSHAAENFQKPPIDGSAGVLAGVFQKESGRMPAFPAKPEALQLLWRAPENIGQYVSSYIRICNIHDIIKKCF